MQRNDKKKIIREQIILVMDLQPSIHRDLFFNISVVEQPIMLNGRLFHILTT